MAKGTILSVNILYCYKIRIFIKRLIQVSITLCKRPRLIIVWKKSMFSTLPYLRCICADPKIFPSMSACERRPTVAMHSRCRENSCLCGSCKLSVNVCNYWNTNLVGSIILFCFNTAINNNEYPEIYIHRYRIRASTVTTVYNILCYRTPSQATVYLDDDKISLVAHDGGGSSRLDHEHFRVGGRVALYAARKISSIIVLRYSTRR